MSPLEIGILLHYHISPVDYRDGDFTAPAVRNAIDEFVSNGMLGPSVGGETQYSAAYQITDKGRFYVDALCSVPLPVATWFIPQPHPPR